MQNTVPLKLLFVTNPVSGGKQKAEFEKAIGAYFEGKPHVLEFYMLTGKDDKRSVQHYIETLKPDRVVAVGGDGTIKMVSELLKETPIPLGIIPAGSANGMAKELGIPLVIEQSLEIIVDGMCKKIDMIKINEEHYCIHLSDLGLNAMLVKHFEHSKRRGMWEYAKAFLRVLLEKQVMRVAIKADEVSVVHKAFMVALANARKYGTGANINPEGNVADGKFEVVVVRRLNVFEILKAIFTNKSFDPQNIEVFSTMNLDLQTRHKAHFQVDGEYLGKITTVKARILPQILNVMVGTEEKRGEDLA